MSKNLIMTSRFSNSAAALALGMAFLVAPALLDTTSPFAIDSAFAQQGGNGNGNGNGNSGGNGNGNSGGNGNGNSGGNGNSNGNGGSGNASNGNGSRSNKVATTQAATKVKHGGITSKLGALNAAYASPNAFLNASPKSRIGKIKAYYVANQVALTAQATADETDAVALRDAFQGSGPTSVVNAYEALQADPTNPTLQDAYNPAVTDAALTGEQIAAVETTYAEWQSAAQADALAANAASVAQAALDAAANKTPVNIETRAALDALLAGKIN